MGAEVIVKAPTVVLIGGNGVLEYWRPYNGPLPSWATYWRQSVNGYSPIETMPKHWRKVHSMAKLPDLPAQSATVAAIYAAYEKNRTHRFQRRIGASQIGGPCDRKLWYGFRWYARGEQFDGRMLRLFETGHHAETRFYYNLRDIGCEVHTHTPEAEQFTFTDCDGHLVCKIDGAGKGIPEAPKAWHVLEFKTHSAKSFKEIKSKGIREAKFEHFAQCVIGMVLSGMNRCLYLAVNKDTDELYSERLRLEECKADAEQLVSRAKSIIEAKKPPARCSEDAESQACKYCEFRGVCHDCDDPVVTCRSCKFSQPAENGEWQCNLHNKILSEAEQEAACAEYEVIVEVPDAMLVKIKNAGVPI